MIPIGDDNSDRHRTPFVTWLLIALNVFVFVVLQGMGSNERVTLAFATVPAEILTGRDIAEVDPGPRFVRPRRRRDRDPADADPRLPDAADLDVHARRLRAPASATCCTSGSSATTSRTRWATGDTSSSTWSPASLAGPRARLRHGGARPATPLIPCLGASGAISGVLGGLHRALPAASACTCIWFYQVMQRPRDLRHRHLVPLPARQRRRDARRRRAAASPTGPTSAASSRAVLVKLFDARRPRRFRGLSGSLRETRPPRRREACPGDGEQADDQQDRVLDAVSPAARRRTSPRGRARARCPRGAEARTKRTEAARSRPAARVSPPTISTTVMRHASARRRAADGSRKELAEGRSRRRRPDRGRFRG